MANDSHHVVPNSDGGWDVKRSKAERASKHFETKQEAVDWGRQVSRNQQTELIVHKQDGRIQNPDSHGNDPLPPRDRK
jgi:hypothetical protein